jgi:hypothetical protein
MWATRQGASGVAAALRASAPARAACWRQPASPRGATHRVFAARLRHVQSQQALSHVLAPCRQIHRQSGVLRRRARAAEARQRTAGWQRHQQAVYAGGRDSGLAAGGHSPNTQLSGARVAALWLRKHGMARAASAGERGCFAFWESRAICASRICLPLSDDGS